MARSLPTQIASFAPPEGAFVAEKLFQRLMLEIPALALAVCALTLLGP